MKKIVIAQPLGLSDEQLAELGRLGDVNQFDTVSRDAGEWLERVAGAEVIMSNVHGLSEAWDKLSETFVTVPFVGTKFFDKELLAKNRVVVARSPGCNQVAVSEWIVAMMLNYARRFPEMVGVRKFDEPTPFYTSSLAGKRACVMGRGYIGSRAGKLLEALGMEVSYFGRGDDVAEKAGDADYIVDCLSSNETTKKFYNEGFFAKTRPGVVFVTVSGQSTKDMTAVTQLLESGLIGHMITDNAQAMLFDAKDENYMALLGNERVTATPHIAAYSDNTRETAAKICVENIKAYLAGKPINLI